MGLLFVLSSPFPVYRTTLSVDVEVVVAVDPVSEELLGIVGEAASCDSAKEAAHSTVLSDGKSWSVSTAREVLEEEELPAASFFF